jgi:ubiquinone/menaquinone biosynthesis C-methylase UbiE
MSVLDWSEQGGSAPQNYQDFLVPAMFAPFAETLVEQAGVQAGSRVLDVACGTGVVSRTAARRAGHSGAVTGIDLGEPTLAVARAQPAEKGAAPIEYLQADATALPVEDAAFDAALCQQGLQFMPDRTAVLSEMRRALVPGGRLAASTWTRLESNPWGPISEAVGRHIGEEARQLMRSPHILPGEELRAAAERAGFSDIDLREETIECTWASHRDFARRTMASGPTAQMFAAASEAAQEAVAREAAEELAPYATPDGRLTMPMTSFVVLARA